MDEFFDSAGRRSDRPWSSAMPRRTKIVATVGPRSEAEAAITEMIRAGVDVFRLNFSHGSAQRHTRVAERIRRQPRHHGGPRCPELRLGGG